MTRGPGGIIRNARVNCSGSVVRPIISAFRAEDSGSNPGRSILPIFLDYYIARSPTPWMVSHLLGIYLCQIHLVCGK